MSSIFDRPVVKGKAPVEKEPVIEVIAGHSFVNGVCIAKVPHTDNVCGRLWMDIRTYGARNVGEKNIAHWDGAHGLTTVEAASIEAKAAAERRQICMASHWRDE
jgi:hypothetical protein